MTTPPPTEPNAETVKLLPCPEWYSADEMRHYLRRLNYSDEIADELCSHYADNLQKAFNKGFDIGQRHESDELKRLRDELQTANTEIDMLRDTLSLIEQSGGRYSKDELGMSYNGSWCAEQARRVLEETK